MKANEEENILTEYLTLTYKINLCFLKYKLVSKDDENGQRDFNTKDEIDQ